jgi:drug/metabolite transporter (DMT)-like permease
MEISIIESLNKSRYNFVKWTTIGWGLFFGTFILKDFINSHIVRLFVVVLGLSGWIIWTIHLVRYRKLNKIINSDSHLKEALSDELVKHNAKKSMIVGYWTVILTICIFFVISLFFKIPALIVCEVTLYVGILSSLIASLIYNKD